MPHTAIPKYTSTAEIFAPAVCKAVKLAQAELKRRRHLRKRRSHA